MAKKVSKKIKSDKKTSTSTTISINSSDELLQLLSSVVEQSSEGIAVVDLNGYLLYLNNAFAQMHGYSPEELLGRHLSIFHTPDQMPPVNAANKKVKQEGVFKGEIWHVTRDGTVFPTLMHNTVLRDKKGHPIGIIGTMRDITEYKQYEKEFKIQDERLRIMVETIPDGLTLVENQKVVYINQRLSEITGYSKEELLHMNYPDIVVPEEQQEIQGLFDQYKHKPAVPDEIETRIQRKDGTIRFIRNRFSIFKKGKNVVGRYIITTDITEQKLAEKALRESEQRFRAIAETTSDAIVVNDANGIIHYWNEGARRIFGYTREEILGKSAYNLIPEKKHSANKKHLKELITTGKHPLLNKPVEMPCIKKNGTEFPAEVSTSYWQRGEKFFFCSIIRDITKRKQAENELSRSRSELQVQSENLAEVNAALKVLLHQRDEDKIRLEEKVLSNIKELILPYMSRLRLSPLNQRQKSFIDVIESNLTEIIAPFSHELSSQYYNLTPAEIQIAGLIKEGKTTKEIAELLQSSARAVEFHRNNLRKKLGLVNKKANLRTFLLSLK